MKIIANLTIFSAIFFLISCAQQSRMGMLVDKNTGLQFGSIIQRNFVIDPSQFTDSRLKIRLRNTSGESIFNLDQMQDLLSSEYKKTGYSIVSQGEHGLLLDVNVVYVGQTTKNLSKEFTLLGAVAGGIAGHSKTKGDLQVVGGTIAGATIGNILGSYQREETFIIIAEVTLGLLDKNRGVEEKKITFGKTGKTKKQRVSEFQSFRDKISSQIAVFAGGRNISSGTISEEVKKRFEIILADII